ncbi:MAG: hypothetical protein IPH93_05340 [Saprospiraceae bacterium]|nr:hypothetical protein [Saprospiraceae bacterium]
MTQPFILPSKYKNSSIQVNSIDIDFEDGTGYQPILVDEVLNIEFPDYGLYKINCRLTDFQGRTSIAQTIFGNNSSKRRSLIID